MTRLVSAIVLCLALAPAALAQDLRPVSRLHGPVPVLDVIDGDTVVLGSDLGPRTVRLIGIDTPEMSEGAPALAARERLRALLDGRQVWVEIGAEAEDRYSRLLAYLYVDDPDGRWDLGGRRATQVNLAMVEEGWADTLTIAPNTAYAGLYAAARASALARGAGLWADAGSPAAAAAPEDLASGADADGALPRLYCALVNPSTPRDFGAEWVSVWLPEPMDTTGYYLWDEGSGKTFYLPSGVQRAGELVVPNPGDAVWNNDGDTIYLMRGGQVVDAWTYSEEQGRRQDQVFCRDAR